MYVKDAEGREIDFVPKSLKINGQLVNGKVVLAQGYSVITMFSGNWVAIEDGIITESDLRQEDSLYPYNHKYLVEGYNYPYGYVGDKIYNEFDEMFAYKLNYVSPELFSVLDKQDSEYYTSYTISDEDEGSYFLIKVNKKHGDWKTEKALAVWNMREEEGNELFVKAVLRTAQPGTTPCIESFKMRVA